MQVYLFSVLAALFLLLGCLVSLQVPGSSSWKPAKISGIQRRDLEIYLSREGLSGRRKRPEWITKETLQGLRCRQASDWRPSLDRIGVWADCLQVGRERVIPREMKGMWTAEGEVSSSYRKEDISNALPAAQTVNSCLKVFPACSQLWVFFSLSKRPSALKWYGNSQLKSHRDRLLVLE